MPVPTFFKLLPLPACLPAFPACLSAAAFLAASQQGCAGNGIHLFAVWRLLN
jgi:hypothetical protein